MVSAVENNGSNGLLTADQSVSELLLSLREGWVTARYAAEMALERIRSCNEKINAFSSLSNTALDEADASDVRLRSGRQRPLEGLPIAVKDMIDTREMETGYGSAAYLGHVPSRDAAVVERLRREGAVVIGKTTTHEFAWGVTTESAALGDTLNPFDGSRTPGGSSGGAAAAIAAGAVRVGLGTDTGGSVRIPASLCGTVGYKPSYGVIPVEGIFPLSPSLDHVGILGVTVEDVSIIAEACGIDLSGLLAGASPTFASAHEEAAVPAEYAVGLAFQAALDRVSSRYELLPARGGAVTSEAYEIFASTVRFEASAVHLMRHGVDFLRRYCSKETADRVVAAEGLTLSSYAAVQERRRIFNARLFGLFQDAEFLLLPTTPCIAPKRGTANLSINAWSGSVREALMAYTCAFNLSGCPAVSIPMQHPELAMPAGLQIVGRPCSDARLLRAAAALEKLLRPRASDY